MRRTALCLFLAAMPVCASVVVTNPDCLPPTDPNDAYVGQYHQWANIDLTAPAHARFTACNPVPTVIGGSETHSFNSTVSGNLFINGVPQGFIVANAITTVTETLESNNGGVEVFNTEMTQLDINAGGILIRESPTLSSTGQTTIADTGGGLFRIDSFFDVFTDLSLDGGQTWIPSSGPGPGGSTVMSLTELPEPGSLLLMGTGIAALLTRLRRR